MTPPFPPPAASVGRFTAFILGFVVFVCVVMIGGTGYLKYQLDRSETVLAAPDSALGSDEEVFDRLRRDLGYGGFLGLAQNYVFSHDASGFAEMKTQIKSAGDIVAHLPEKTPAETRHDLGAIVSVYDAAMQKLSAPAGETSEFTAEDLAPLYAALPVLDSRVASANAETRLAAQNRMQFWGMLLTLVSWCSLIIAAACAAGIYLALRDKHSAPMRALAQSIQNMARGDMRTAIWGIERQDMIGELARAVDIARYHFSHLPDLSLLSEQGPVRMRFEGGSRSLFEAMMKAISRDSENIREQAATLGNSVREQKDAIATLSEKVTAILQSILQSGQTGDKQLKQAIHEMSASAESLKNAHAHAADQLNRLLPYVQDRVHGMAEIAQITGKQVTQTLHSLTVSELGLKANAEQARETLAKLSSTADDLGERMFGAINLLQASGKVLAETTEQVQHKLLEGGFAGPMHAPAPAFDAEMLEPLAQLVNNIRLLLVERVEPKLATMETNIAAQIQNRMSDLAAALDRPVPAPVIIPAPAAAVTPVIDTSAIQTQMRDIMSELGGKISALTNVLPQELRAALQPDWQRLAAQMESAVASTQAQLTKQIEQQGRAIVVQTMDASAQARDVLTELSTKVTQIAQALPANMQQNMQDQWYQISAHVEASRASIERMLDTQVAGKMAAFERSFEQSLAQLRAAIDSAKLAIENPPKPVFSMPPELQKQLSDQWFQMAGQIEASRANLIETVTHQIELLEGRLSDKSANGLTKTAADYATQRHVEQQTQILSELVATLSILDTHMQQIKTEIHARA